VALIGAIYAGVLGLVYGSPIPQSIGAKVSKHVAELHLSRIKDNLQLAFFPIQYMVVLVPVVVIGIVRSLRNPNPFRPFAVFSLAVVAAYLAARSKTWGWYYYVPLTAWAVWFGLGCEVLAQRFVPMGMRLAQQRAAALAVTLVAVGVVSLATALRPDRVTPRVYRAMEAWVEAENIAARGARIMASDIGAIGWYADTRILDSMGRVGPRAVEYAGQLAVVRDQKPDYRMMVATRPRMIPFALDEELKAMYEPIQRFSVQGLRNLNPDPEVLPGGWVQDYIMYRYVRPD